jgi:hypothetical protein
MYPVAHIVTDISETYLYQYIVLQGNAMHVLDFVACGDFTPRLERHCEEIYKEVELSFLKFKIIPISFLVILDNRLHYSFWDMTPCSPLKVN